MPSDAESTPDRIAAQALEAAHDAVARLQAVTGPLDRAVLFEAWDSLRRSSKERADESIERGERPRWALNQAAMMLIEALRETLVRPEPRRSDPISLAWDALAGGDLPGAADRSFRLLAEGNAGQDEMRGELIHHGHLILGHVRLREGDVAAAEAHLLEAGRAPRTPTLRSFGPNMSLALALLRRGRRDAVLEYFKVCSSLWDPRSSDLPKWWASVQHDEIPDFGPNLIYGSGPVVDEERP